MGIEHMQEYHRKRMAGEIEQSPNHGKRGPDKKPRKGTSMKSFEKRYYERTGRTIFQDMQQQMEEIDMMREMAMACNDPDERFQMLKTVNEMRNKYNNLWAPYLQSKQGVVQTDVKAEEMETLDDILGEDDDGTY